MHCMTLTLNPPFGNCKLSGGSIGCEPYFIKWTYQPDVCSDSSAVVGCETVLNVKPPSSVRD